LQLNEPLWKSKLRRGSSLLAQHGPLEIWRQARRLGPRECAAFLDRQLRYSVGEFVGRRFDRRYGVDTSGCVSRDNMQTVGEHGGATRGADFMSVPEGIFRRALGLIPESDFSQFTFIDFGCGKGRALLLAAASRNFRRVIGVEHAPMLVEVAERNIRAWRGERRCDDVRIICADAINFELPHEPSVLFFFGPFGGDMSLLMLLLDNVAVSFRAHPRRMYIVYTDAIDQPRPDQEMSAVGFRRRTRPGGERHFDPGAMRAPLWYALYEHAGLIESESKPLAE